MNVKVELEEQQEPLAFPKLMISITGNLALFSEYGKCVYLQIENEYQAGLIFDDRVMENFTDFHGSIEITQ